MTKCGLCGREGTRGFMRGSNGNVTCEATSACARRVSEAEQRVGVVRIDSGSSHWYKIDGLKPSGVTTILKQGIPAPALVGWGINAVARYAADNLDLVWGMRGMGTEAVFQALRQSPYSERNAAGARGTKIHAYAELYIAGMPLGKIPPDLHPWVTAMADYIDDYQPTSVLAEIAVGSRKWRYAGTFDDVSDFPDGVRRIVDYKTGKRIYPETVLQLNAYANPEGVYKDPEGVERSVGDLGIQEGYAVHIRPEGYAVHPVPIGPEQLQAFVRVQWLANLTAKDGDLESWLGDPLPPRKKGSKTSERDSSGEVRRRRLAAAAVRSRWGGSLRAGVQHPPARRLCRTRTRARVRATTRPGSQRSRSLTT
jgi:hypothetical protein